MRVSLNGCGVAVPATTTLLMELSLEEAEALAKSLGATSISQDLSNGLTREQSQMTYNIYDKLDDMVAATKVLTG